MVIIIGLGANLPSKHGTPAETIYKAITEINSEGLEVANKSNMYLTEPIPASDQDWYHNMTISIKTTLGGYEILGILQKIENKFGRVRTIKNAPRVIDLDLITYNNEIMDKPELIVPHPRMHERAFVLLPMHEIVKNWIHPISKKHIKDLTKEIEGKQNIKIV